MKKVHNITIKKQNISIDIENVYLKSYNMFEVIKLSENLGIAIKSIRTNKSLSQFNLAERAGISQSFLSDIESGQKSPTLRSIYKISQALEISPGVLLAGDLNKNRKANNILLRQKKMEEKVNSVIEKFYKKIFGLYPDSLQTRIIEDMIIIRYNRPLEYFFEILLKTDRGKEVYKNIFFVLFEFFRDEFIDELEKIVACKVKEIYYDEKIIGEEMLISVICCNNLLK